MSSFYEEPSALAGQGRHATVEDDEDDDDDYLPPQSSSSTADGKRKADTIASSGRRQGYASIVTAIHTISRCSRPGTDIGLLSLLEP